MKGNFYLSHHWAPEDFYWKQVPAREGRCVSPEWRGHSSTTLDLRLALETRSRVSAAGGNGNSEAKWSDSNHYNPYTKASYRPQQPWFVPWPPVRGFSIIRTTFALRLVLFWIVVSGSCLASVKGFEIKICTETERTAITRWLWLWAWHEGKK